MSSPAPAKRPSEVLVVLLLAGVSFALSQTLVIPALPTISRELGASASATSWMLTGFLLSASISTPIVGKLGDVYGKGRILTVVLLVFSFGGVVCALSTLDRAAARRTGDPGRGRRRVPARLRHRARHVPARARRHRARAGERDLRDRRRDRAAAVRGHRRQLRRVVDLLDHADRAPGGVRCLPARAGQPDRGPRARRLGRRRAAVRGAGRGAAGGDRGQRLGLGLGADIRAHGRRARAAPRVDALRGDAGRAADRPARSALAAGGRHEPDRLLHRRRDVLQLPADPPVRPDAGGQRLRLRLVRDRVRAAARAGGAGPAHRRPARGQAGGADRVPHDAHRRRRLRHRRLPVPCARPRRSVERSS